MESVIFHHLTNSGLSTIDSLKIIADGNSGQNTHKIVMSMLYTYSYQDLLETVKEIRFVFQLSSTYSSHAYAIVHFVTFRLT